MTALIFFSSILAEQLVLQTFQTPLSYAGKDFENLLCYGTVNCPTQALSWLSVEGRRIIDQSGQEIVLHGVNLEALSVRTIAGFEGAFNCDISEMIKRLNCLGARVIRLCLEGQKWSYPEYVILVDKIVAATEDNGMYIILSFHRWDENWTGAIGLQSKADLIMGVKDQQPFLDFWTSVASRFKDNPAVLYSLLNEPNAGNYKLDDVASAWYDLALKTSRIIHRINPKALILVSTLFDWPSMRLVYFDKHPIPEPNVAYVWHDYYAHDLIAGVFQYAMDYSAGNLAEAKIELGQFLNDTVLFMLSLDLPIIMEECGASAEFYVSTTKEYVDIPNWDVEIQHRYELYRKSNLGWIQWIWKKTSLEWGGFGLLEDDAITLTPQGTLFAENVNQY